MSIIYVHQFHIDLLGLNEDLYHVYIDSHVETGGGRDVVFLRQHERGIPLTLRENFSDNGTLTSLTEQRDIVKVENEFQTIRYVSEKQSPKLAGYVKKRLQSLGLKKNI